VLAAARRLLALVVCGSAAVVALVSCTGPLPGGAPDLQRPSDRWTAARLASFARDTPACLAALRSAGVGLRQQQPVSSGACGYADGIALTAGGPLPALAPAGAIVSCPVGAGLYLWARDVVQPAALRYFGTSVVRIDHFGSYACRRVAGSAPGGDLSEHARANAIDIAGFRLADGRRITVARDWNAGGAPAAFLRAVRDGACHQFGTTLSPDYNAAHADHLHLDQAARGPFSFCR